MMNGSKELQMVVAGLFLGLAALAMPFLKIPILIGLGVKAIDEFLKQVVGVDDGLWGVLKTVASIGSAINRFMFIPLFKTVGVISDIIRKAMQLAGIGGKDGSTGAMHDSLTDTIKDEGHESRRRSTTDISAVTKELQDMGRINQYSPYSMSGPERRLGAVPAIAPPVVVAPAATPAETTTRMNGGMTGLRSLLEQISKGEGTTDDRARAHGFNSGYDVSLGYGAYHDRTSKPISSMTLGEIKKLQAEMLRHPDNKLNSSAVGKYQIVGKTLRPLQKQMGISDDEVFSPELQDRMAQQLLRGRGLDNFLAGRMDANRFQSGLAQEWASVAAPGTGRSAYGQATGTSSAEIQAAMAVARASAGATPETSRPLAFKPEMKDTNDLLKQILEQQRTASMSSEQYQQLSMLHRQTSPENSGGVADMLVSRSL
jgi:muramidase (phage lysozyme)